MNTGEVKRISAAADGTQSNAFSLMSSLSGDGSTVTFLSLASNLVPGDNNGQLDFGVSDGTDTTMTTLTFTVTGVNDAPTSATVDNVSVDENSAAGTVATELGVIDPDGPGHYDYAILNDTSGLFTLDGNIMVVAEPQRASPVTEWASPGWFSWLACRLLGSSTLE